MICNADPGAQDRFWLTAEYLPEFLDLIPDRYRAPGVWAQELHDALGDIQLAPLAVPHDCADGFYGAFWRRPHAYLDPRVRAGISVFWQLAAEHVDRAVGVLGDDLASGAWERRHADLLRLTELDLGFYVVVAELDG